MILNRRRSNLSIFSVSANALLSFGGYATGRPRVPARATVVPSDVTVDIGVFVAGSTFVGHGTIVDGAARLTLRRGLLYSHGRVVLRSGGRAKPSGV